MNRSTQLAQEALDRQGFVVMAWSDGAEPVPEIGDVRPGPFQCGDNGIVDGPMVVRERATRDDWFKQARAAGFFNPQEPPNVLAYFKMVAE